MWLPIIHRLQSLYHKPGVEKEDWGGVHPNLLILAQFAYEYCQEYNLPMVITSIIRPRIPEISRTDTHAQGRAFDISVRGWSDHDIEYLVQATNKKFHIGAISLRDKLEREAVYEDGVSYGTAPHIHFQVRR